MKPNQICIRLLFHELTIVYVYDYFFSHKEGIMYVKRVSWDLISLAKKTNFNRIVWTKKKWNNKSDKTEQILMISHESVNIENWWLWMNGINPTFSKQAPIPSQPIRPTQELHRRPQQHRPSSLFPSFSVCVPMSDKESESISCTKQMFEFNCIFCLPLMWWLADCWARFEEKLCRISGLRYNA